MTAAPETRLSSLYQGNMPVKDLDRAIAFSRDTLSVPFYLRRGSLAFFGLGAARLLLEVLEAAEGGRYNHPGSVLSFSVPNIHTAHRDLTRRGVAFVQPPELISRTAQHERWMAFFSDGEWNTHATTAEVPLAGRPADRAR